MALNREDIQKMTVQRLRLLDISDPEDEKVVQDLISEKLAAQPFVGEPARAKPHATDNLTPETEAILQTKIDAQNANRKARVLGLEVDEEDGPDVVVEVPGIENEADIEANLAQLQAEKAALEAAAKEPFVPTEMITDEMREAGVDETTPLVSRESVVAELGEEAVADIEASTEDASEAPVVEPEAPVVEEKKTTSTSKGNKKK